MDYQPNIEYSPIAELSAPGIRSTYDTHHARDLNKVVFIHDGKYNSITFPLDAIGTGGHISQKSLIEIIQNTFAEEEIEMSPSIAPIADKINAIRKGFGIPMTLLAKSLGISRQAIYDWIKGEDISTDNVDKIQKLYNSLQELTKSKPVQLSYHIKRKIFDGVDFFEAFRNGKDPIGLAKQLETILFIEEKQSKKLNEKLADNNMENLHATPGIPTGRDRGSLGS